MKIPLLLIAALLSTPALGAGKLRDPTRPLAASARAAPTAPGSTPATAANAASPAPVALPVLQLVLVGSERRYAVIDGELRTEGDAIGALQLLQIRHDSVVLKTPNGASTLPLSPPTEPLKE